MKIIHSSFFAILLLFSNVTYSQITPAILHNFLSNVPPDKYPERLEEIRQFYAAVDYSPVWIDASNHSIQDTLLQLLQTASEQGLEEKDYQYAFIQSIRNHSVLLKTTTDSLLTELKLTDAAIHFFSDIAYGNTRPAVGYDGLGYKPGCRNIPATLAMYCRQDQLAELSAVLEPSLPEVKLIRQQLIRLQQRTNDSLYKETRITSIAVSHLNKPLLKKLYYLGISDSADRKSDTGIKESLKEAQRLFNLLADGKLRSTVLQELNIPIPVRMQQLTLSLNYYRWLYCLSTQEHTIVVNIPAAYLKVYGPSGILLEMRMVVGKPSTPTPALTSRVSEVILYPYWMVPHSIATKELLRDIKRNPGFINANNFQVLNNQGKIMDPYKINWQELSRTYFPYIIRQSTGCDNSLGLIKINFYNPYSVYLHDTPSKSLFLLNKRYFSHGCMRMENPMALGHLLLKNNSIAIDTLEEKGCIQHQSPVTVAADEKIPVIIWYNPVGTDASGRVIFYEDIYRKWKKKNQLPG